VLDEKQTTELSLLYCQRSISTHCQAAHPCLHFISAGKPPASKARQRVPMPNPLKGKNLSSEIQR